MQLLHDELCINGGVASQLELWLPQTLPVFGPEPYKHPKTTKLNPNTPWMKCNKKTINIANYCFLPSMGCSASASSDTATFGRRIASFDTTTFGRRFASSDTVPFSLFISNSPQAFFLNLLPLAIITLKKEPPVILMLILRNYIISMFEEKIISATIEEGDDIVAVTFFAAKPQKKGKFAISLQQSEEGGGSCRLLLQYKVPTFFAMQLLSMTMKGNCSCAAPH